MSFWNRQKLRLELSRYKVTLLHDTGHQVIISNISEKNLIFIRQNIGKDVIYAQDDVYINLNKFSYASVVKTNNKGENDG